MSNPSSICKGGDAATAGPSSSSSPSSSFIFGSTSASTGESGQRTIVGGGGFTFSVPSDSAPSYDYLPSPPPVVTVPSAEGTSASTQPQWVEPAYDYLPSPPSVVNVPSAQGKSASLRPQWLEPASSNASEASVVDDGDQDDDTSSSLGTSEWEAEQARIAQEEWEEGLAQLQLAVQVIFFPFVGKWLGRKWSYWAFSRYKLHGLSATFFGLSEGAPWTWIPASVVPDGLAALSS